MAGEAIPDQAVLRGQPGLFGEVALHVTAWRALAAVDNAAIARISEAGAGARAEAWAIEIGQDHSTNVKN